VSIGKPMFGTNLKIDNNELLIGGNQVNTGYLNISNNQSAFVEISSERFYKTGDIAELKNSIYYCMGRLDRQVKIQGFRVELSEIEHVFNTNFPECESIALLNQKNHQDQIILCIICKTNFFNIGEASETLKSKLPYYMVPSKIQRFENWPLNSNGKIDKKQLLNDIQNTES
jgi:acyl-CoA synthetase (AMP-forming)/AMP-acid ligase II